MLITMLTFRFINLPKVGRRTLNGEKMGGSQYLYIMMLLVRIYFVQNP